MWIASGFSRERRLHLALTLTLIAYFGVTVITRWRTEHYGLLASQLGLITILILENLWPEPATRPKAVTVAGWAVVAASMVLMAVGTWRDSQAHLTGDLTGHRVAQSNVVPTPLQINPAQGSQGTTLEVTITGTSFRFTDRSLPHFGLGIAVLDSRYIGENTLVAHIEIVAGTPVGFRRVWVSTPEAHTVIDDSGDGAFTVFAGPAGKQVQPSRGQPGKLPQ